MMRALPIPAHFAEHAHLTKVELAGRYGVSTATIMRWRDRLGLRGHLFRATPAPADFAHVAPGKSIVQLGKHYGVGGNTIARWRKETGVAPLPHRGSIPVPAPFDLVERYRALGTLRALQEHYRREFNTVKRWVVEAGLPINPPGWAATLKPRRHTAPSHHRIRLVPGKVHLPAMRNMAAPALSGREQEAAQHLRRSFPHVYRCDEKGHPDQKGKMWRCGALVLQPAELIERAEAKGWRPDAWQELAA